MCRTCALHSQARAVVTPSWPLHRFRLSASTAGRSVLFLAALSRRSESRIRVKCAASIQSQDRNPSTPRLNRWSLDGITALVTGGTHGVGRAVLEELVGFGARVHTCARNAGELQCCLSGRGERGYGISDSVYDVSIREQTVNLIKNASSSFGGNLNILVNNVGRNIRKPTVHCRRILFLDGHPFQGRSINSQEAWLVSGMGIILGAMLLLLGI